MVIMAAEVSSVGNRKHHGFVYLLSSAACEWLLICLLFVEAIFLYLLPKFAHCCELQPPCPLCSRFDHLFAKKEPGYCWTLLCSNHKEEISSLVSCASHGNLVDIEGMCQECLVSTVTQKNSDSGAYKVLVGKLWVNVERSAFQNLMLNKHITFGSSGLRTCCCCNKTWRTKPIAERLLELEQAGLVDSKSNPKPPLPCMPGRSCFSRRENLKRMRNKATGSVTHQPPGWNGVDKLSHVGYTTIKFTSGSESEIPFSEDDDDGDDGTVSCDSYFSVPESEVKIGRRGIPRPPVKNVVSDKQARQRLKDQQNMLHLNGRKNVKPPSSDAVRDKGSRELESECYHKPSPSLTTDPLSLNDVSRTPDVGSSGVLEEASNFSVTRAAALSALAKGHSLPKAPSSITVTGLKSINIEGTSIKVNAPVTIHIEAASGSSSHGAHAHASEPKSQNLTNSSEHTVEPINASASCKTEEGKSLSQASTSELGSSFSKATSSKPQVKQSDSRKDDDSTTPAQVQASTSDVGGLSPKETSFKTQNGQYKSIKSKENHDQKNIQIQEPSQASLTGVGSVLPKYTNAEPYDEVKESTAYEAGGIVPKDTGFRSHGKCNEFRKGEDSNSHATSHEALPEVGGILPKDTNPKTYDEHKESMANEADGIFPKDSGFRPHAKQNESRKDEDSTYLAVPESPSANRNDSTYESVKEIEGESALDRLMRQVEHDQSIINSLNKELEEERNASDIAANEAMVMITKLQEEKAALHTEALQYLRMMEEQSEYDMEALQRANDLLADREKELQDLEDELEFYRNNFDEPGPDHNETSALENHVADNSKNSPGTSDSKLAKIPIAPRKTSPSELENEKFYIMDFMKKLEEELRQAYCSEELDMPNRLNSDEIKGEVGNQNDSSLDLETLTHPQTEDSASVSQKNSSTSNGNSVRDTASNYLHDEKRDGSSEAFEQENAVLHGRFETLETDRDFLRHATDLLWSGNDGIQLIQEVAHQLKELRKIEFKKR